MSRTDSNWIPLLAAPLIVNGAFSIELALKAILTKNRIEYGREHNLVILFQRLPDSLQYEMWTYLIEKAPEYKDAEKCFDEIVLLSNAFVDWRYAFEDNPVPAIDSRFLFVWANAAICTMLSHYNVDFCPAIGLESDDKIEQKFRENRKNCKTINMKIIKKKSKGHRL